VTPYSPSWNPSHFWHQLSRARGLRDKNRRGFSGFKEGVYLNPCSLSADLALNLLSLLLANNQGVASVN
jgi:hypothetical protein